MKILQLCKKFPYPLMDGESIAIHNLSKSLHQQGCEVTLLAMNTLRHYYAAEETPEALRHYKAVYSVDIDNRIKPHKAFLNLFSSDSYHIARFVSTAFGESLKKLLQQEEFDVVQLETLYLAPYIPLIRQYSRAVVAMRAHNVEHEIWERITANTEFAPKRWYLDHLTGKLRRFEKTALELYDILVAISERDLDKFRTMGYRGAAAVIPIGIEAGAYQPDYQAFRREPAMAFIGSLDWMPNIEGLKWFLDAVWPDIRRQYPDLQLHIAGRNTPGWLQQLDMPGVTIHGEVPDAAEFINRYSMLIVPLLSGSGMRAKILEGMALGKVVLTTSLGLEGIIAHHEKEVLVADTPQAFLQTVNWCFRQNGQLESLGRNAQQFVSRHYDNHEIGRRLLKAYSNLIVEAI